MTRKDETSETTLRFNYHIYNTELTRKNETSETTLRFNYHIYNTELNRKNESSETTLRNLFSLFFSFNLKRFPFSGIFFGTLKNDYIEYRRFLDRIH